MLRLIIGFVLKGWMADLFKDYKKNLDRSGGKYSELSKRQFDRLKRVREIQRIKEELEGVDVKGLKSGLIGDEIDFDAVASLMKKGVMNHGNNNPKEENNDDPEFELGSESDQSSNESLSENELPSKKSQISNKNKRSQVLSGDENDEKIDYGKRIQNDSDLDSDDSDDDDGGLFLNAEDMLKASQSKLKKERKKSLKLKKSENNRFKKTGRFSSGCHYRKKLKKLQLRWEI